MTATEYTIEIAISLEQNSELNLIELARRVYRAARCRDTAKSQAEAHST